MALADTREVRIHEVEIRVVQRIVAAVDRAAVTAIDRRVAPDHGLEDLVGLAGVEDGIVAGEDLLDQRRGRDEDEDAG